LSKRAFELYAAHIMVVAAYIAGVACVLRELVDPDDLNQFNVAIFLNMPSRESIEALALRCRPVNPDVLPLYILLWGVRGGTVADDPQAALDPCCDGVRWRR
jgi:hypothetical protein